MGSKRTKWPVTCKDTGEVCFNYEQYLQSEHWINFKRRWSKRKKQRKCVVCKKRPGYYDFHHRTYERVGREYLKDVVIVCRSCHGQIHDLVNTRNNGIGLRGGHNKLYKLNQDEKAKQLEKLVLPEDVFNKVWTAKNARHRNSILVRYFLRYCRENNTTYDVVINKKISQITKQVNELYKSEAQ